MGIFFSCFAPVKPKEETEFTESFMGKRLSRNSIFVMKKAQYPDRFGKGFLFQEEMVGCLS